MRAAWSNFVTAETTCYVVNARSHQHVMVLMRKANAKTHLNTSACGQIKRHLGSLSSTAPNTTRTAPWSVQQSFSPQPLVRPFTPAGERSLLAIWSNKIQKLSKPGDKPFSTMSESKSWWKGSSKPAGSEPPTSLEFKSMEIPEESATEAEHLPTRRVHILGLGSIGTLIAHSLQCLPNPPPISLLMHRPEVYHSFSSSGRFIRLLNPNNDVNDEQNGYDVDVLHRNQETGQPYWEHIPHESNEGPINELQPGEKMDSGEVYISTLIVTVKGPRTRTALQSVKHRINAQTTICLVQNGMGQVDELNEKVFTDPATRPTYMLGIISHGAHTSGPFAVIHAGFGTTALGIYRDTDKYPLPPKTPNFDRSQISEEERKRMYPTDEELYSNISSRYLLRTLTRSPILACAPYPYLDLLQLQLEKLVMNSVLNPLTALLDIPNGSMMGNTAIAKAQRLLLAETSFVFRNLPELDGVPGVKTRFAADRLEALCTGIAKKTAKNSSSMREDVRKLAPTEIQYINGYVVRRGQEQGIKCVLNYLLMKLVQAKTETSMGNEVKPYGTEDVQGDVSPIGAHPEGAVRLEDRGTRLKGRAY